MDSSSLEIDRRGAESPKRNRLSIAHLLLWMAMTGVVLARFQRDRPPPPEEITFGGSFLHQSDSDEEKEAERRKQQRLVWRQLNLRYYLMVLLTPFTGAAYSGAILGIWRTATRQFGFPAQPGHWLFFGVAGLFVVAGVRPYLQWHLPGAAESIVAAIAAGMFVAIALAVREPIRWRFTFGLASVAFAMAFLSFLIKMSFPDSFPVFLVLGESLFVAFPIAVLFCSAWDCVEPKRYDVFHWIGIGVFFSIGAGMVLLVVGLQLIY